MRRLVIASAFSIICPLISNYPARQHCEIELKEDNMLLCKGCKILMIGDSITDCGRPRPVGEGAGGMGSGYVNMVNSLLTAVYPDLGIRVVNMGISGNRVRDLKARWQTDVVEHQPDWLSIMIGINDVWRQFDNPLRPELHVRLDEYQATLEELVTKTVPFLKGMVLMTPYFLEPNRDDPMRKAMDDYSAVVRHLAQEHKAVFVDTQSAFDRLLRYLHPMSIAADRVHPNAIGHMVLARAFLDAVQFDWSRRT